MANLCEDRTRNEKTAQLCSRCKQLLNQQPELAAPLNVIAGVVLLDSSEKTNEGPVMHSAVMRRAGAVRGAPVDPLKYLQKLNIHLFFYQGNNEGLISK